MQGFVHAGLGFISASGREPEIPHFLLRFMQDGSPEEQAYKVNILGTRCLLILALHPFLSGGAVPSLRSTVTMHMRPSIGISTGGKGL